HDEMNKKDHILVCNMTDFEPCILLKLPESDTILQWVYSGVLTATTERKNIYASNPEENWKRYDSSGVFEAHETKNNLAFLHLHKLYLAVDNSIINPFGDSLNLCGKKLDINFYKIHNMRFSNNGKYLAVFYF